jgi:secondary thiamine-phosphate synthase enzyme
MNSVHLDLSFSAVYAHTPEAVWAALTDRDALRTWFLENDFSPHVGHAFSVRGPQIGRVNCVVVALDAPSRMEWSWHAPDSLIPTRVIFTLDTTDGGTRLTVKHVGAAPHTNETDIMRGWPSRLNRLSRWLDGSFFASVSRGETSEIYPGANPVSRDTTADRKPEERAMTSITVASTDHEQVIDLTGKVAALATSMKNGVCHLLTRHTTCALTILTDEEGIAEDLLSVLHGLVPQGARYVHDSADHVRAHVLSALVGPSVSVPVRDGQLTLGQFQRIVLLDFEGPRERTVVIDVSGN